MEGRSPDRIPWMPRMELWWRAHRIAGTLPERYADWRLHDIERDLGMGTPAREGRIYTSRLRGVDVVTRLDGPRTITEYITPVGTVSTMEKRTAVLDRAGIGASQVDRPLKRPEDYDAMMYIVENTEYFPCYEEYEAYDREVGDHGYPLVTIGQGVFMTFLGQYAGYEKAYLDLADYPDKVERLLETMNEKAREELWPLVVDSPARLICDGGHFDTQMTPPPIFKQFITPYYQELSDYLHQHGRTLVHHADADSSGILADFSEAGYDMVECFATAPLVDCTLKQARDAWGDTMIIWGGVPSILVEPDSTSEQEFEEYMADLFRTIAPGNAFVLGVADNVTANADLSRIVRIGEMVEEYGNCPIQV